jgi:putative acetyltransferase
MALQVRPVTRADHAELRVIFNDAVTRLGAAHYDAAQVRAWLARGEHADFTAQFDQGLLLVAERGGRVVGFIQLAPINQLALLYVHSAFARQGVATALCEQLEQLARQAGVECLQVAASRCARAFFAGRGYRLDGNEWVDCDGQQLERFRMHKRLTPALASTAALRQDAAT